MYIPKLLVDAGADINITADSGMTALAQSIEVRNNKLAEFLLKKGANIYNTGAHRGKGPLFRAIKQNNLEAVELLCDHGADLANKNKIG